MSKEQQEKNDISQDEMDKLDANLLEIDLLYKSRCVKASGNNVKVREIDPKKE